MIIKSPIDLELTQSSGQIFQDPWMKLNDSYNDVALVDNKPVFFSVSHNACGGFRPRSRATGVSNVTAHDS